jgi:H+/Cl- antiporter ClcA
MISFLTGVTRVPFTCFVLVLEMTGVHSVIFYMMITAVLSNLCASIVDKESFYERIKLSFLSNSKDV